MTVAAWLGAESNRRHVDLQSMFLTNEQHRKFFRAQANCQSREGVPCEVEAERSASQFRQLPHEQMKNEGQVALEMGNSPKVLKDHYFEVVDERAAREYWSIKPLPTDDRKIVAIAS